MVPLDEPFDDHAQHPESQADGGLLQRLAGASLTADEPLFVAFDVATLHLTQRMHVGLVVNKPTGEQPQAHVGTGDAVGP